MVTAETKSSGRHYEECKNNLGGHEVSLHGWKKYRISDMGKVVTGRTPPSGKPQCFGDKYPFITPSDMDGRKKADVTERYLSDEGADLLKSNLVPSGSVSVSCIGWQMGKSIMTSRPSFTNQQLNTIIPNDKVDTDFLYYSLLIRREELLSLGATTGVRTPILNKSAFSDLDIVLPPLPTQRKIAAILSAYDDLIENNTRRIKLLEEMAQALYREWFVKFRFPGHENVRMVELELGMVPDGWGVKKVKDILKRLKAGNVYAEHDVIKAGHVLVIDQSRDSFLGFHNNNPDHMATPEKPIIIFGDHTCKMQLMVEPFSVGPNVVPFISQNEAPILYLYFLVRNLVETKEYKRHWTELTNKTVVLASNESARRFASFTMPIFEQIDSLMRKNLNLRRTRDLLLPKLISGEVDLEKLNIKIPTEAV